jgi:GNAT superfamily N-acetyltransferase
MQAGPRQPQPPDPGALMATTHAVGAGLRVRLRLTRPSDARQVRDLLESLSPEARVRRFRTAVPEIGDRLIRHFTFFDPRSRLVVAATAPLDGSEVIVGLADLALLSTGLAEVALVVRDHQQGLGIGRLLSHAVASLAMQQGATHLKAEVPDADGPVLRLMEGLGPSARAFEEGRSVVYTRLPAGRRLAA